MSVKTSWIPISVKMPDTWEMVWISDGEGRSTLGIMKYDIEPVWCQISGSPFEEDGELTGDFVTTDIQVRYWLPIPETSFKNI